MPAQPPAVPRPPIAPRKPATRTLHGRRRTDDYAWLKDENWQQVMRNPVLLRTDIRARLEAELAPDAVLVTGDLIDLMKLPGDALDPIAALAAPAFFAVGNHERYIGSDAVCARLEALGVTVRRPR